MVCYVQHICKKLNFHKGIKSSVTLWNTHPRCAVFLNGMYTHQDMYIYEMKSVTTKRCSLRHTYRTNCIPTTKIKLSATQQDGWPTINSNYKTLTQLPHTWTNEVNTRWNSRLVHRSSSSLVIGCGRSTADHVTRDNSDTCCHCQKLPASESHGWYHCSPIHVAPWVPTPPIAVSGGGGWLVYLHITNSKAYICISLIAKRTN